MKITLIKQIQEKFLLLDTDSKKIIFEGANSTSEEEITEMESLSVTAAKLMKNANNTKYKPNRFDPNKPKLTKEENLVKAIRDTLDEYWEKPLAGKGKRREYYSDDFIDGHCMAFHQLVEKKFISHSMMRAVLDLPPKKLSQS